MTATEVTAIVLELSGASQFNSSGNNITVSPPRQACRISGQFSRNQTSNSRAWRRDQNISGRGFREFTTGVAGVSARAGSK